MKREKIENNYLFMSDLDGTLLNENHKLERASVDRLNAMIQDGLRFTYITSRDWKSSHRIMKNVDITLPVAICQGAAIVDFKTGKILKEWNINSGVISKMLNILQHFDIVISIITNKEGIIHNYTFNGKKEIGKLLLLETEQIISLAFKESSEKIRYVYENIDKWKTNQIKLTVFQDADNDLEEILEIVSSSASKGVAARAIANMCRLNNPKVIAFGNDSNDIELLKYSEIGIGIGNISKDLAHYASIQLSYNEGLSVLEFIEEYFYQTEKKEG